MWNQLWKDYWLILLNSDCYVKNNFANLQKARFQSDQDMPNIFRTQKDYIQSNFSNFKKGIVVLLGHFILQFIVLAYQIFHSCEVYFQILFKQLFQNSRILSKV